MFCCYDVQFVYHIVAVANAYGDLAHSYTFTKGTFRGVDKNVGKEP